MERKSERDLKQVLTANETCTPTCTPCSKAKKAISVKYPINIVDVMAGVQ